MTDSPLFPPSAPAPILPIAAAALLGGAVLGGGYWLADRSLDRQIEQRLEQGIIQLTGVPADCARANGRFFSPRIQIQDCQINNVPGFPSGYLLQVGTIDLESRNLRRKPPEIDRLTLQNLTLNLDIKADLSPQNLLNPKALFPINLGEALAGVDAGSDRSGDQPSTSPETDNTEAQAEAQTDLQTETSPEAAPDPANPSFTIKQLQIQNITATLQIQAPLFNPSHQFQLDDITLTEVTAENLEAKIFAALREEVSTELQVMLGDEAAVVGQKALEILVPVLRRSLEAYLLGLPF